MNSTLDNVDVDFIGSLVLTGLGSYKQVTHVEVKNPVGLEILLNTNQKLSLQISK